MKTTQAYYKKRRTSVRKAAYTKRRDGLVRAPRSVALASWNTPFRTTLKYSDVVLLSTTVGTGFVTYVFRPFSIYDIDLTGTGHQPLRYDQLSAMFQSYRVRGVKAKFNFSSGAIAPTTNFIGPWRCTVTQSRTNSTLPGTGTDVNTAPEMERAVTGVYTPNQLLELKTTTYWTDLGVNNIEELNTDVGSTCSQNMFYIVSVYNQGQVAATATLVNVDFEIDCEFITPKTIATS